MYVVHKNSISLRESFRSKKFVYSESRDSHNSLIEVATQISSIVLCWVLYKYILLFFLFTYTNGIQ